DAQRDSLIEAVQLLGIYFQDREDVYVSGNLFIYYEEGNPEAVVAPDTFVILGIPKRRRRSYKVWEENNKTPDFVLEISSKSTRSKDQGAKKGIYAFLEISEYFQYDPTGDYLKPQLQGLRFRAGNYLPIPSISLPDGTLSLRSEVLELDLRLESGKLRFYNPIKGEKLMNYEESERARVQLEEARLQAEEARLQAEEARLQAEEEARKELEIRQAAEARIAELEAQLQALQKQQPPTE
ncbi:MAG: Uma2 family endonuclease, partial [Microcystaceae cyanobacterium]